MKTSVNAYLHIYEAQEARAFGLTAQPDYVSLWIGSKLALYGERDHILDTLRNAMVAVQALEEES